MVISDFESFSYFFAKYYKLPIISIDNMQIMSRGKLEIKIPENQKQNFQIGKRIVQAWRASDFPPGIFSMAAFVLSPTKDGGTELVLTHRGVPKELIPGIEKGWREYYWDKMKEFIS